MKKNNILGIDVGGTFIKYGLVNQQWQLVESHQVTTPKTKIGIINLLVKLIKNHKNKVTKVGLGLPGRLDIKKGIIISVANLPLSNTSIVKLIKNKINLPIKIDNDARCFALAESLIGAGKNYQIVIGLTFGSGVGGGIVINKKLYHGLGNAGELGHQFINYQEAKDLEDYVGSSRLKLTATDFENLVKNARLNNKRALNFWQQLGLTIGFGIVNIIHAFDPEIIILGGKLTKNLDLFYPIILKIVKKYSLTKLPKIVKSKLIDKAGILGAALLFK